MVSITRLQCHFIANWRLGILALLVGLCFCRLGVWQLARADEKTQLLTSEHQLASQQPLNWFSGSPLPLQYQPMRVQGHFLPITLLLDNQHYQHQFGYDVLSPLLLDDGQIILVDRGFVPGDSNRDIMPLITTPSSRRHVLGTAYFPSDKSWALGNIFDKKNATIAVIELVDMRIIGQFLHKSVYPFMIRLHPSAADGFVREWPVVAMSPSRHIGYAVQWFAMAFVVVLLFILLNIKKKT